MAAAINTMQAVQLVEEMFNENKKNEEIIVSDEIDYALLKSFLAKKPIHNYYGIIPNDFSQYSEKNESDMITSYYKDMVKNKLKKAATSVTRRRTLFTDRQAMSETIKIESENKAVEDKNGKPYFNIELKFSLNGGFDLSIQKKNILDRTLLYIMT